MQYFLDTSVILYAAGSNHEYKKPCVEILERIARNELDALTSTEVLQEIVHRYIRLGKKHEGIRVARNLSELIPVMPVDEAALHESLSILEQCDVDTRDALHAAIALHFGIGHILSADKHFDLIPGITRVDPAEFVGNG